MAIIHFLTGSCKQPGCSNADASVNLPLDHANGGRRRVSAWIGASCLLALCALAGCDKKDPVSSASKPPSDAAAPAAPSVDVGQVIERYRTFDSSRDSATKMRVSIQGGGGAPRDIQLTMYRKRAADGRQLMLIEFTAPPQERDRDAIVTTTPQGEVEGLRYAQSNDSFVSAKGATNEDSLFGLTLQELVEGQPEKYDFKLIGEETLGSTPVYRVEGKLKQGAESKFPREVLLISKENYAGLVAELYDNHNELDRRMTVDKIQQVNGHWTRMHWTVDNREHQKTLDFQTLDAKYDQNLSDSVFAKEHLKKLALTK